MWTAETIARALGGRKAGAGWMARCPAHDDRRPSLSVRDADSGKVLVHCFAGCPQRDVVDALRRLGKWPDRERKAAVDGFDVARPVYFNRHEPRRDSALKIWDGARDPAGTPAIAYLDRRQIALPPGALGEVLRWHPACPFGAGHKLDSMVALVRDVGTDERLGIHRTAIGADGRKLSDCGANGRLALGPVGGGAVKLSPDEDIGLAVGIGEGIESTLSLRNLEGCTRLPVWALLTAGQVARFPVLAGIETLWVAVDHDRAGILAARQVSARWRDAGREVLLIAPKARGADLNDVVIAGPAPATPETEQSDAA